MSCHINIRNKDKYVLPKLRTEYLKRSLIKHYYCNKLFILRTFRLVAIYDLLVDRSVKTSLLTFSFVYCIKQIDYMLRASVQ